MPAGQRDIERAAAALASRLPEPLAVLARLAYNYRWALDAGRARRLPRDRPAALAAASTATRSGCCRRPRAEALCARRRRPADRWTAPSALEQSVARRPRASRARGRPRTAEHPVAFFCAEYGVHASLPIYSGGLGALAGDILKEASDRALPFVAVGLMYRRGYFRQRIDHAGWQQEYWVPTDPERTPAVARHRRRRRRR